MTEVKTENLTKCLLRPDTKHRKILWLSTRKLSLGELFLHQAGTKRDEMALVGKLPNWFVLFILWGFRRVPQGNQVDLFPLVKRHQHGLGHGEGVGSLVVASVCPHQSRAELVPFPIPGWAATPVHQVQVTYNLHSWWSESLFECSLNWQLYDTLSSSPFLTMAQAAGRSLCVVELTLS